MAKRMIRKRTRKNKTIRKVMRGCNGHRRRSRSKVGGLEAAQYPGASPQANQNLAGGTATLLEAQQNAGNSPPPPPAAVKSSMANTQKGGARTRQHSKEK